MHGVPGRALLTGRARADRRPRGVRHLRHGPADGPPRPPAHTGVDVRRRPRGRRSGTARHADELGPPKALWLLDAHGPGRVTHQPDVITAQLTGEAIPTDSSHALKTGYDAEHEAWPPQLASLAAQLPEVVRPGTRLGEVCRTAAEATGIPAGTPVIAGMTDGCAAQIASGALRPGAWNSVLGTTLVLKGASPTPSATTPGSSTTTAHRTAVGCRAGRRVWARARCRRDLTRPRWTPGRRPTNRRAP